MEIKFKNGSALESIESIDNKRRKQEEIVYYMKNPYRLIEDLYGENLHLYQKLWIKFIILERKGGNYGESRRKDYRSQKKNSQVLL